MCLRVYETDVLAKYTKRTICEQQRCNLVFYRQIPPAWACYDKSKIGDMIDYLYQRTVYEELTKSDRTDQLYAVSILEPTQETN